MRGWKLLVPPALYFLRSGSMLISSITLFTTLTGCAGAISSSSEGGSNMRCPWLYVLKITFKSLRFFILHKTTKWWQMILLSKRFFKNKEAALLRQPLSLSSIINLLLHLNNLKLKTQLLFLHLVFCFSIKDASKLIAGVNATIEFVAYDNYSGSILYKACKTRVVTMPPAIMINNFIAIRQQ
jgi:hypothetical protein